MSNEDPQWLDPAQQNAWRALVSVVTRLRPRSTPRCNATPT